MKKENIFYSLKYREITIAKFEIVGFLESFLEGKEYINLDLFVEAVYQKFPEYKSILSYCISYLYYNFRINFVSKNIVRVDNLHHFNFLSYLNDNEDTLKSLYERLHELKFRFHFTDLVILAYINSKSESFGDLLIVAKYTYKHCFDIARFCLLDNKDVVCFIEKLLKAVYGRKIGFENSIKEIL